MCEQFWQDFQRDGPIELRVARSVDLAHAAGADGSEEVGGTRAPAANCLRGSATRVLLTASHL